MGSRPAQSLTFVLTDLEGSTELWERDSDAMRAAMDRHDELVITTAERFGGTVVHERGEGDSTFTYFPSASAGLSYAFRLQHAFLTEPWPTEGPLRIRVGVHTGRGVGRAGSVTGPEVNRCARVRSLAAGRQILVSGSAVAAVGDDLPDGLGLRDLGTHRLRGLATPEHLYQLTHEDLPDEFPPLRTATVVPNNLPAPVTNFIGRDTELTTVRRQIREHRLVTITGPGGAGKTRLALRAGEVVLDHFPDGVWFIELASLTEEAGIVSAIASATGARPLPGRDPMGSLQSHLREATALLIVDNCEHLIDDAAAVVSAILRSCATVRILATSREVLRANGEAVHALEPLPAPVADGLDDLARADAARLFVDRVRLQRPDFAIEDDRSARAVGAICRRLDGLPLALELAAARTRHMALDEIVAGLDDRFSVLDLQRASTPTHQRTLEASIAWSVDPLPPAERAVFRRCAIFSGSFTAEGAEVVCAADDLPASAVTAALGVLVERSLVAADATGHDTRFRLLETIKAYAWRSLEEADEVPRARAAHFDHMSAVAALSEHDSFHDEVLHQERPDIVSAVWWGLDNADPTRTLSLVVQVTGKLGAGLFPTESREWLQAGLANGPDVEPALRAAAMRLSGDLALAQGDIEEAESWARRSLAEGAEERSLVGAHMLLGNVAHMRADYDEAMVAYGSALRFARELGDDGTVSHVLASLGNIAHARRDYDQARNLFEQSLDAAKQTADPLMVAEALSSLASVAAMQREYDQARAFIDEARRIALERNHPRILAMTLTRTAAIALEQGDLDAASAAGDEAIAIREELDDARGVAATRLYLAEVARLRERFDEALALAEASYAVFEETGLAVGQASALLTAGDILLARGSSEEARARYAQCLEVFARADDRQGVAAALEGIAVAEAGDEQFERATVLFGAAARFRETVGSALPPSRASLIVEAAAAATDERLRAHGARMSLADVIVFSRRP